MLHAAPHPTPPATPPPGCFVETLSAWHNATHGTSLTAADYHSYHFADVWGDSDAVTRAKMEAFFASPAFAALPPVPEAAATLRQLRQGHCRFVVVTSRDHSIAEATRAWLKQHYEGIFEDVLFGNHYGLTGVKRWVRGAGGAARRGAARGRCVRSGCDTAPRPPPACDPRAPPPRPAPPRPAAASPRCAPRSAPRCWWTTA